MTEAVELRARLKEIAAEGQPVPTFNDMVVKACARALREFPRANGAYRDGHFELYSRVNVGVAVAAQDALVVPTIFDADRSRWARSRRRSRELAQKVRDGTITPPELSGGTFTVSNLGMFGVSNFSAVINPPQAALLAVGALEPKAGRRPRHAPGRGARHDGRHARLRPPHPLRRGRRAVPRRACATCSSSRSRWRSDEPGFPLRTARHSFKAARPPRRYPPRPQGTRCLPA